MNATLMNGLSLAYIGDAYFEIIVRQYLLEKGITKVNELHKEAIKFTSGEAQAKFIDLFLQNNILSELEIEIYKKGRNSATSHRKNLSSAEYQKATGFEAIIGYLYESNNIERINELFTLMKEYNK
ncbi:MAG: Mini-ribonuclease 3 [Acholeplasmatales bacterium]|nr:Mini-ribonuclease 3 [Acholeplasmatales bacterium]